MVPDRRTDGRNGRTDGRTHGRRQNYIPPTLSGDKKRKTAFPTVKNIVFDRKITFLQSITIYVAEHNHRWKIENVVVADRVLINAFAIVACMCDTTTSPVFFCFVFINLSILSCR